MSQASTMGHLSARTPFISCAVFPPVTFNSHVAVFTITKTKSHRAGSPASLRESQGKTTFIIIFSNGN